MGIWVSEKPDFETLVLPHLDAGYNLARWLLRDEAAAEDVTQEASIRAMRYFDSLKGDAARPWFLGIVRNACYSHIKLRREALEVPGFDDDAIDDLQALAGQTAPDPAALFARQRDRLQIDEALRALPPPLREVIVLREMEGLEYAEIAQIAMIPMGTVMSRLSRGRARLKILLTQVAMDR